MHLKEKAIQLKAGEKKKVHLLVSKSNASEGEYNATIIAKSTKFGKTSSAELKVYLEDCFEVSVEKTKGVEKACIENPLSYEFSLENTKENEISFSLSVDGLNATVNPKTITLRPNESKKATVDIDLSKEKPGNKEFSLKIVSPNFTVSKTYSFKLNDCYALSVDYDGATKPIEITISKRICQWEKVLTLIAKNIGTMDQEVSVTENKIDWVSVEPSSFSLKAGEKKEFYVYITPPLGTEEGDYKAVLSVKARDYSKEQPIKITVKKSESEKPSLEAGSELEKTIITQEKTVKVKVTLKNTGNCALNISGISSTAYNAKFDIEPFSLERGQEKTVTATLNLGKGFDKNEVELPLSIKTNKGQLEQTVKVSLVEEKPATPTPQETPVESPTATATIGSTFVGLAPSTVNLLILLFLAIVAVVIVMLAYYAYAKTPATEGKGQGWHGEPRRHSKAAKKGKRK